MQDKNALISWPPEDRQNNSLMLQNHHEARGKTEREREREHDQGDAQEETPTIGLQEVIAAEGESAQWGSITWLTNNSRTSEQKKIRKRQKTRKSRVQEISKDRSRIIHPSLTALKHNSTSIFWEFSYPWREELPNSDNFLNPRLPGVFCRFLKSKKDEKTWRGPEGFHKNDCHKRSLSGFRNANAQNAAFFGRKGPERKPWPRGKSLNRKKWSQCVFFER